MSRNLRISLLATSLVALRVVAQQPTAQTDPNDKAVRLSPFQVEETSGYTSSQTASGTRIRANVQQLPFEVNIVTNDFLEDFAAFDDYRDEFAYISGITTGGNYNQAFFIRGFQNNSQLRDGFVRAGMLDMVSVDRIEVIEGPEAAIYGVSSPGGTINVVSKQPQTTPQGDIILRGGSHEFARAEVSATGPISTDMGLYYRVDYSREHTEFGFAHNGENTQELSAVLQKKWKSGLSIQVNADKIYTNHFGGDPQLMLQTNAQGVSSYAYELGAFNAEPKSAYTYRELQQVTLHVEDEITNWLSLRLQGYYQTRKLKQIAITQGTYVPATGMITGIGNPQFQWTPERDNGLQGDVVATFDLGSSISNSALFGFDYLYTAQSQEKANMTKAELANPAFQNVTSESVSMPNYLLDTDVSVNNLGPYTALKGWTGTSDRTKAVFGSEQMFLDQKRLTLLGTIRDNFLLHEASIDRTTGLTNGIDYKPSVTYEVGANYAVTPTISIYGDWATSYILNTGLDSSGHRFDNETGAGWEAGVKGNWQNGRYTASADIFNVNREHVLEQDPLNSVYSIDSGSQNSHGAEFDFFFKATSRWTLFGQMTRLVTTYTQNTSAPFSVGTQVFEIPPFSAGVATRYDFGHKRDQGLYMTMGYRYIDWTHTKDLATASTYLTLPSYYQLDASAGYGWKVGQWLHKVVLNGTNLTNETSYMGKAVLNPGIRVILSYELYFK